MTSLRREPQAHTASPPSCQGLALARVEEENAHADARRVGHFSAISASPRAKLVDARPKAWHDERSMDGAGPLPPRRGRSAELTCPSRSCAMHTGGRRGSRRWSNSMEASNRVSRAVIAMAIAFGLALAAPVRAADQSQPVAGFDEKQVKSIQEIIHQYILDHPEVI